MLYCTNISSARKITNSDKKQLYTKKEIFEIHLAYGRYNCDALKLVKRAEKS